MMVTVSWFFGADCQDKIVGLTCQELIDVHDVNPCQDHLGHQVCARFCGFC